MQLQSSEQLFDIAFAIKKFSFCGALFKRILAWKRDISKKITLRMKLFLLLIVFDLPYSKYKGEKIYFYSCRYQNQNFSLVQTRVICVELVSHSCR